MEPIMPTTFYELHKICRICLKSDLLVSFLAPMEMIKKLQLFKLQAADNHPTLLCQSCLHRLVDAYNLKQQAEVSEKRLHEFLRENDSFNINNTERNSSGYSTLTRNAPIKDSNDRIYANICDMFEQNVVECNEDANTRLHQSTEDVINDVEIDVSSLTRSEPDDSLTEVLVGGNAGRIFKIKDKQFPLPLQMSYKCHKCGKEFDLEEYSEVQRKENQNEEAFLCKYCSQHSQQSTKLSQSTCKNSGTRRFQCEICASFFTTSSNLKAHKQTHLERRDFSCAICKRSFKSARGLRRHGPVHKTVKDVICEVCKKAFTKRDYLSVHMAAVHRGIRRHKCMHCGKAFAIRSNLLCHLRTHTGEKPFKCKYCALKFNQSSTLARHMKKHSKTELNSC